MNTLYADIGGVGKEFLCRLLVLIPYVELLEVLTDEMVIVELVPHENVLKEDVVGCFFETNLRKVTANICVPRFVL